MTAMRNMGLKDYILILNTSPGQGKNLCVYVCACVCGHMGVYFILQVLNVSK